ncbi:unnamed protein product [Phytophthora fragariaefolia]|uniref:Unnamed protein product n=1 Tax=Phytophthora fragariaefolia TaxID=1490495 RepID=A0A9W7CSC2_9STRA|nr:unnamed protein product [Phytophthora fragariaefolia]
MTYAFKCQGTEAVPWTRHVLVQVREQLRGKIRLLSQLLKKDPAWDWTAECQQAFDAVKQGLTEAPILAVVDEDRPFHVVCDASDFAIGCALMQQDHEGRDRVVYYQSRQLKPAELNYPVYDKELLCTREVSSVSTWE